MNRKELCMQVRDLLRDRDCRKKYPKTKHKFHISDDEGNVRTFEVTKSSREILYNIDDVECVIEATFDAIKDSIRCGEDVILSGFGSFGLRYLKPSEIKHVLTGEKVFVPGHYLPTFSYYKDLKDCAAEYTAMLNKTQGSDNQKEERSMAVGWKEE